MSLSDKKCELCDEDEGLYLHGRCHISSPTWSILKGDILSIVCAECNKPIVTFQVIQQL